MKKTSILFGLCAFFLVTPHLYGQVPGPGIGLGGRDFFGEAMGAMQRAFDREESEATLEDAYFLGRAVAAHILTMYPLYTRNPRLTQYLNMITQTLVINSPRPTAFRGYFVAILDSPSFNAFATPGGHIFLTRGLVDAATSEDMLAAVIAHELAHIMLDHGLNMVEEMARLDATAAIAGRAAAFSSDSPVAERVLGFRSSVSTIVETLVRSGYSQEQEFAADRKAVELLVAAGYNPRALVDMLRILQQRQGAQPGGLLSTHPPPAERIRHVEDAIRRHRVTDTSAHRRVRFANR